MTDARAGGARTRRGRRRAAGGASATCAVARAAMTLRGVEEDEEPFPVASTSAGRWGAERVSERVIIVTANEFW